MLNLRQGRTIRRDQEEIQVPIKERGVRERVNLPLYTKLF